MNRTLQSKTKQNYLQVFPYATVQPLAHVLTAALLQPAIGDPPFPSLVVVENFLSNFLGFLGSPTMFEVDLHHPGVPKA